MYGANLSFKSMKKFVQLLTDGCPVKVLDAVVDNGHVFYKTNQNGRKYLAAYHELQLILNASAQTIKV